MRTLARTTAALVAAAVAVAALSTPAVAHDLGRHLAEDAVLPEVRRRALL